MTNSLLKVTLILLSLVSAVFVGQLFFSVTQTAPSSIQGLDTPGITNTDFEIVSVQQGRAQDENFRSAVSQSAPADSAQVQDTSSSKHSPTPQQSTRRSFSFHYLDILEWLFAGRSDKAKHHQPQRPSASLNLWQ